uniref:ER membrane protein complex subunit 2 n=1 Tax=Timema californicum TaxID=61474 RepID=A0A7R9J4L5_TIMCA|nr:unnamed protein product [Timema californicum]
MKDSAVGQRGLKQRQGKANNLQAESNKSKPQDVSSKPREHVTSRPGKDTELSSVFSNPLASEHRTCDHVVLTSLQLLNMALNIDDKSWTEVRDLFRSWREENVRRSLDVVDLWETVLAKKINALGDEKLLVYEQVVIAALDCNRLEVADVCLKALIAEFPTSLRVRKLRALQLEAREKYDDAVELLDYIIKQDETNAAPRKRKVAILKAKGKISDAIKELTEYLKKFMSDQEGWQELSELYLQEQDFGRAAFCMEELILHNPHSHLIHQHYAEIKYTQARDWCATNIAINPKSTPIKRKEANKLAKWALKELNIRYDEKMVEEKPVAALELLMNNIHITTST